MFNLIKLESEPVYQQLRLEEALLRTTDENFCVINTNPPKAIVMGISGKKEELVHDHSELPLIRRYTGGGCVVIDEDTFLVTFIGNSQLFYCENLESPTPEKIHQWALKIYKPLFKDLPFFLNENDYCFENRKFGGNAQHIARSRFVHHSTLLWSFQKELMSHLKHPPKKPAYRNERPHDEFLTPLKTHFSSKSEFFQKFETTLSSLFPINHIPAPVELLQKPHRTATVMIEK